jgi:hypothetical protein
LPEYLNGYSELVALGRRFRSVGAGGWCGWIDCHHAG